MFQLILLLFVNPKGFLVFIFQDDGQAFWLQYLNVLAKGKQFHDKVVSHKNFQTNSEFGIGIQDYFLRIMQR